MLWKIWLFLKGGVYCHFLICMYPTIINLVVYSTRTARLFLQGTHFTENIKISEILFALHNFVEAFACPIPILDIFLSPKICKPSSNTLITFRSPINQLTNVFKFMDISGTYA